MIHTQKKNTEKLNGTLGPEQNLGWENGICTPTPHPTPSSGPFELQRCAIVNDTYL